MTMKFSAPTVLWGSLGIGIAMLSACGGGGGGNTPAPISKQEQCEGLAGKSVSKLEIGLPTNGANITSSNWTAANASGNTSGEFCKITAQIMPFDTTAPVINLEVDLPTNWNEKSLHFGGGGWDGTVPNVGGFPASGFAFGSEISGAKTPLSQGYVTYGSDSGNPNASNGSFAVNDEARANYAGDHIKKVHDVVASLEGTYYGKPAQHSFFVGGSSGGRQAIIAAQRFPEDYDGVISTYPALQLVGIAFQDIRIMHSNFAPGGFISSQKGNTLKSAVMSQCDALDGLSDGVISNVKACNFDPQTIRCPNGTDTSNACLSDAQITTARTIASPLQTNFAFDQGLNSSPGYNLLTGGSDFWPGQTAVLGASSDPEIIKATSFLYTFGRDMLQFSIARNPSIDPLQFDPTSPGELTAATQKVSALYDASSTDLTAFKRRGGKLILQHGYADQVNPTQLSIDYYNRVVQRFGQEGTQEFIKFYLLPGAGHGFGSQFAGAYDALTVLDKWVIGGTKPANLVVTDLNTAGNLRARPLCDYPLWPKYIAGSQADAKSFQCTQ